MSLLLDALKKAAEKKARSDADKTEIDAPEVQAEEETQLDSTVSLTETQLDSTQHDATEFTETHFDDTHIDGTSVTQTHVAESELDKTEVLASETDQSAAHVANADAGGADTEDETLRSTDFEETDKLVSGTSTKEDDSEETVVLTPDDVTDFLGDGLPDEATQSGRDEAAETHVTAAAHEPSDDTTITNSEQLDLTQFDGHDEPRPQAQDETDLSTVADTESPAHYRQDMSLQPDEEEDTTAGYDEFADDEKSTAIDTEATASTVDIERLTNDETVTVKDSTITNTFAPDNYDRTLLKITDSDVSKIFPGMKAESEAVMTPEYAKKVFQSKSSGVKRYYYKVYLIAGVLVLGGVLLWGMFTVSNEIDLIDNSLVRLKRDPMPGMVKPQAADVSAELFTPEGTQPVDERVMEVVASADAPIVEGASDDVSPGGDSDVARAVSDQASKPEQKSLSTPSTQVATVDAAGADQARRQQSTRATQPRDTGRVAARAEQAPEQRLWISSDSRVSEKDQLLTQAYNAYESGDIDEARSKYDRVLKLESDNRDALLGRAAVHVLDNRFNQAIALYQKLLIANPKDDVAMTSLISVASVDPRAGETEVKRLLNERPDSPYLHFALGNMYGNQQRWPEAQAAYFNALRYKPADPNYAYNLAVSLEHMQQSQSAISYYQRALENRQNGLATFNSEVVEQRIEVLGR